MSWLEALILGIVQGLTEYLPVSSSGHLAIGSYLFGIDGADNLTFTVLVHVATVLSTFVVLWSEIDWILKGLFKFKMNDETKYFLNILVSMIPIGIVGVFFKDKVEQLLDGFTSLGTDCCSRRPCSSSPITPSRDRRRKSRGRTLLSSASPRRVP